MFTAVPAQRGINPATTPVSRMDTTVTLSDRTVAWLAEHSAARVLVDSVWDTLAELERAGHPPRLLAALRFVLVHHGPTPAGRCRACRRVGWRGWWQRRRFPCVVWRQIRSELLGPLALGGVHRHRAERNGNAR